MAHQKTLQTTPAGVPGPGAPVLARPPRRFIGETLDLTRWDDVKPLYDDLLHRPVASADALRRWFRERSELESYLSENFAWRYVRMTCNTADASLMERLNEFIRDIQPYMTELGNELDQKALASPFLDELANEPGYAVMIRGMRKAAEIFRAENIPLQTEIQTEEQKYGAVTGAMTVTLPDPDGRDEELTLPQATDRLLDTRRNVREAAWRAIQQRRYQDHGQLDELYSRLIGLRHRVAVNAGFANFRDYIFAALGRFDYTPADCFAFHRSVGQATVPLLNELATGRQRKLARRDASVTRLRPWDTRVDPDGYPPLKPFATADDLIERTIACFDRLDGSGQLGQFIRIMRAMGHLDLESRRGKAPGGYNYPMEELGVPFIFMNATASLRDLVTMVHEGGHAVHSFLMRDLPLKAFRNPPMEVAELASMSMELLTMDHWDVFFEDPEELRRARLQHLESIIETLAWVATIDKFQHWVYENPTHNVVERRAAWVRIYDEFSDNVVDWGGLKKYKEYYWQRQLHLYDVPFYYVEYGIAQLGAIGVWQNYRRNPQAGLQAYLDALRLGYQVPIREIYATARVPFDFSAHYVAELMQFVWAEINQLKNSEPVLAVKP